MDEVYRRIDNFLLDIRDGGGTFHNLGNDAIAIEAKLLIFKYELAYYAKPSTPLTSWIYISNLGILVIDGNGSKAYIEEKTELINREKELAIRKLKIDVELGDQVLKDYKTTKLLSRIGVGLSAILLLLKVAEWITKSQSSN